MALSNYSTSYPGLRGSDKGSRYRRRDANLVDTMVTSVPTHRNKDFNNRTMGTGHLQRYANGLKSCSWSYQVAQMTWHRQGAATLQKLGRWLDDSKSWSS